MVKNSSEKDIFVFGDSCTQGFWDSKGGWATRLKQYFDDYMVSAPNFPRHGFYYMVYPLGITDDTTKSILERFEFETEKRMVWPTTEEIFVFAIGKNDTAFLDIAESRRNIQEIIKRAKRFSDKISFLEVGAVDEKITQPVSWDEECYYDNSKIKIYNNALNEIAKKNGVKVIPLFEEWQKIDYKKLLADGVHPNNDGHKYIFEKVKDFLLKNYF
ncbi:MAG: GDSL-type esterase/lipase family protein [Candidatus Paceibacterota bacterium]